MSEKGLTDGDLAAELGVSDELVRLWRHGRRSISAKRAIEISKLTGIPRHQLRPDLWDEPPPTVATVSNAKRTRAAAPVTDARQSSEKAA